MKGYFITYVRDKHNQGINAKIDAQIKAFNTAGLNCTEYCIRYNYNKVAAFLGRIPFINENPKWRYDEVFADVDYIYFRRPFIFKYGIINFLSLLKKNNKNIKILCEIPTYPYDDEIVNSFLGKTSLITEKHNRKFLHKYIDRMVTLTDDKFIYNIPALKIDNGIDFSQYNIRDNYYSNYKTTINLCAVAMFAPWHGYERVLNGLIFYYKNGGTRNIVIHFVGEGNELSVYKNIADNIYIKNHVKFYGLLDKNELDNIYNICDASLGSFGAYKKNLFISNELKSSESLAKGIPIISGCRYKRFEDLQYKYMLNFENNATIVDMKKIVNFIDNIYEFNSKFDITWYIRNFGINHFSIDKCMETVFDYIYK